MSETTREHSNSNHAPGMSTARHYTPSITSSYLLSPGKIRAHLTLDMSVGLIKDPMGNIPDKGVPESAVSLAKSSTIRETSASV